MAMKKPVVATNVGGNVDLITDGKNGFLVPVRDHQQIALALKTLIANSNLRTRMGALNRQTVKKFFSWNKIIRKVETLYNEIA
jgi:glycosyltransferase involved in cell wall biosynthesis